jgi:GDP-4-dehydro-6-deoxy-D-mannose reductase
VHLNLRVLVTGITGFVGPYLARKLLDLGHEVYGLFRRRADGGMPSRLVETGIVGRIRLVEGDVTDLTSLLFALDRAQPDVIFHLASQSYVPRSFVDPLETFRVNSLGTQNLLEAVRLKDLDCKIIFAGSSEEYGLQIASEKHYEWALKKYGTIFPEPGRIPELPVNEGNPLRPMSPYAVSKVHGDFLMRNYHHVYGLKTIVSRAFNHEGAGRGHEFVTSTIVRQCVSLKFGELDRVVIGNVNVFRDWSHVEDIVDGYILLAEKSRSGDVYVQGSMRTNSVLTYTLLTLQHLGYDIKEIETLKGEKMVKDPSEVVEEDFFKVRFTKTKVDALMLKGELEYTLEDGGLNVKTDKGNITIVFDKGRFRPADVPILMSDAKKIQNLGFKVTKSLKDIIRDQVNYYLNPENRRI